MRRPPVNAKRNGVRAREIPDYPDPPDERGYYGIPGDVIRAFAGDVFRGFLIACPGCGQFYDIAIGCTWRVQAGTLEDVTTLTLLPSMRMPACCGWHGMLKGGVFECL